MKDRPLTTRTVEPVIALGDYLDALFRPVQEVVVEELPQTEDRASPAEELVRSLQEEPAPVPEASAAPAPAGSRLQLLLLDLGGLRLAVPLEALSSIHRLPEKLTRVPHQQPWLLGVYDHHGVKVAAVDTFGLVVPPSHRERLRQQHAEGPPVVVTVGGGRWGLVCHDTGTVLELERDEVKWRSDRSVRPWLAGTVKSELCALLDVEAFVQWLEQGAPGWIDEPADDGTPDA